jgi:hypothetical protein
MPQNARASCPGRRRTLGGLSGTIWAGFPKAQPTFYELTKLPEAMLMRTARLVFVVAAAI